MATSTFLAPFTKTYRAVKERGWLGTIIQLYTVGDLKFGTLKGTDRFGNKYQHHFLLLCRHFLPLMSSFYLYVQVL